MHTSNAEGHLLNEIMKFSLRSLNMTMKMALKDNVLAVGHLLNIHLIILWYFSLPFTSINSVCLDNSCP